MTPPEDVDVLVVGAGLAGLPTATQLARQGHEVLLAERRPTLTGAIRTTGIFVRKTLDDFALPPECLGPPIRRVVLYPTACSTPRWHAGTWPGWSTTAGTRTSASPGTPTAIPTACAGR